MAINRLSKYIKLGTRVLRSEIEKQISKDKKSVSVSQVKYFLEGLNDLKGGALKLGQIFAIDPEVFFPPETHDVIKKFKFEPKTYSWAEMSKVVESNMPIDQGWSLQKTPIASGSIAQVYKGLSPDYKPVVFKVLLPEIEKKLSQDIKMAKTVANQFMIFTQKETRLLDDIWGEITEQLFQEIKLDQEAKSQSRFRKLLANDGRYIVPYVYKDVSNQSMMVSDYHEGLELNEWLETSPSQKQKDQIGNALLDLFFREFYYEHFVQTDPNLGNFLITKDNRIVLIDFGAVKEFSSDFVRFYLNLIHASHIADRERFFKLLYQAQWLSPLEIKSTQDMFWDMMESLSRPFKQDSFYFNNLDFLKDIQFYSREIQEKTRHSKPPKELFFLHRKVAGVFLMNKKLDVKANLKEKLQKVFEDFSSLITADTSL